MDYLEKLASIAGCVGGWPLICNIDGDGGHHLARDSCVQQRSCAVVEDSHRPLNKHQPASQKAVTLRATLHSSFMHQYITDTEFASKNLLQLATYEENQLQELSARLRKVEAELKAHRWDFETSDLSDDFSDAYVMGAFGRMAKVAQHAELLQGQLAALQASIGARQQAVQAIAGALLQIAKQGISVVHGGLAAAPEGRTIGTASLKEVIWQARNQALHYEDGKFKKPVTDLFSTLEKDHGAQFSLTAHACQSRAKQVIGVLGWKSYAAYLSDMQSLLP